MSSLAIAPSISPELAPQIIYLERRCKRRKVRHKTEASAQQHLHELQERDQAEGIVRLGRKYGVYHCPECDAWHVGGKRVPVPLVDLRAEVLGLYDNGKREPSTYRTMRRTFDLLAEHGLETAGGLDERFVGRFVEAIKPTLSPVSIAGHLRRIRIVANHCLAKGYMKISPFARRNVGAWVKAVPLNKRRFYTRAEIKAVLDLMKADVEHKTGWPLWKARRLLAMTAVVAFTGIRASEAFYLQLEDVDLEHRALRIVSRKEHKTKTVASEATIAMPEALVPILSDWLDHRLSSPEGTKLRDSQCPWLFPATRRGAPWTGGSPGTKPRECLQAVAKRAGIVGNMTFLGLRHSWATHAETIGIPGACIQRTLRHTSERTSLAWYRHTDVSALAKAVSEFGFD